VRIVSLLPSATEILFAVGAGADVVGVTFECDFPAEARRCRIVSNTSLPGALTHERSTPRCGRAWLAGEDLYTLDEGALRDIDPDLVVTQDLCAVCAVDIDEVDKALEHLGCRAEVLTLDPMTLDEVLSSIETVGPGHRHPETGHRVGWYRSAGPPRAVALAVASRGPSPDGGTRMDRSAVLVGPLGAGHGDGGRRCAGARGERRAIRADRMGCGHRGATRRDRRRPLRLPPRRCDASWPNRWSVPACVPPRTPVWAVDADAAFVRPGPRVVDGTSRRWPTSPTRGPPGQTEHLDDLLAPGPAAPGVEEVGHRESHAGEEQPSD
jgi:iron complex transport system substrate-binding protein